MNVIAQQTFKSSSSSKEYVAAIFENGDGYCDCPAWKFKRKGQPRTCTHLEQLRNTPAPTPVPPQPSLLEAAGGRTEPQKAADAAVERPLNPMLASAMTGTKTLADYANDDWRLEPKFDGHRLSLRKRGAAISAWSRGHGDRPTRTLPPHLTAALQPLPDGVYDGELMAPTGKSWDVVRLDLLDQLFIVLFDIVESDGLQIDHWSYEKRRVALELATEKLPPTSPVHLAPSVPVSQAAVDAIYAAGGEGAMLKRRASRYIAGIRTADWLKVVPVRRVALTITGFGPGSFGPHSVTMLQHADGTKTSVKTKDFATMARIVADTPAWIGRRLVCSYRERTKGGAFRHLMRDYEAGDHE